MIFHLISQTLKGKTVNRLLMNEALKSISVGGKILDLGAGTIRSSYFDFLRVDKKAEIVSIDALPDRKPDIVGNLEDGIPLPDQSYDAVLCFNLLEHVFSHQKLVNESYRVLRQSGRLIGYVPFLVPFHPDPQDYFRYTRHGLERIFKDAGFSKVEVIYVGRGPFTAAWSQVAYILPRVLRWVFTLTTFILDSILVKIKLFLREKYPLGYVFIAEK